MNYNILFAETDANGNVPIGTPYYRLLLAESVEIHKSVDLLADTCTIKLPDSANNQLLTVSNQKVTDILKRGYKVTVQLGYNNSLTHEFAGYLLSVGTDEGSITLNCEDSMFLLRKPVKDKQFNNVSVKQIAQYVLSQCGVKISLNCSDTITYDKFTIVSATGYDVLKKIEDDTKDNIYIREYYADDSDTLTRELNLHPLYEEQTGMAVYSFQHNVEESDLKYMHKEDLKIQIVLKYTGKDGKLREYKYGTTGGDQHTRKVSGLSASSLKQVAENEYNKWYYDGYDGSITGWLIPYCEPTYSAAILDEDYPEKDGTYYVSSVTTTFDNNGGKRKIQVGKKLGNITNGQIQAVN